MNFSRPHLEINRDWCLRLDQDCVPGRAGCVPAGSVFVVPVEDRLRARSREPTACRCAALWPANEKR